MTPRVPKFALTAHVISSVGWLGAVLAFLALALTALSSPDPQLVHAAYLAMAVTGWSVLVPLSVASLLTGLVSALGSRWGLLRHYRVLVKLLMNLFATIILLLFMTRFMQPLSDMAAATTAIGAHHGSPGLAPVVHTSGALLLLLTAAVLSVYKPRGLTRYGQRKQNEQRSRPDPAEPRALSQP